MFEIEKVSPAEVKRMLQQGMRIELGGGMRASSQREQRRQETLGRRLARHSNPTVAGVEETIDQPIYDTVSIAASTAFTKTVLFQSPIGQNGKTLAQTNMVVGGQLQNPQYLELHSISVPIANNTTLVDLINILTLVSFTLTVGTKPMLQVPVWFLPAGCGAILNSVAGIGSTLPATAAVGYSTGNGIADPRAVFALSCPFVINTGESFNVTLNPETPFNTQANTTNPPGLGTTIAVKLDGVLYRGVQ
jgi:hypothetical protein